MNEKWNYAKALNVFLFLHFKSDVHFYRYGIFKDVSLNSISNSYDDTIKSVYKLRAGTHFVHSRAPWDRQRWLCRQWFERRVRRYIGADLCLPVGAQIK